MELTLSNMHISTIRLKDLSSKIIPSPTCVFAAIRPGRFEISQRCLYVSHPTWVCFVCNVRTREIESFELEGYSKSRGYYVHTDGLVWTCILNSESCQ